MRSLLFAPGDSERKLEKSLTCGADVILIDLEDSVAPDRKQGARKTAAAFLASQSQRRPAPLYVRINDLQSGMAGADLETVLPARPDGIMLPKAGSNADVEKLAAMLTPLEKKAGLAAGSLKLVVLAFETPHGVLNAASFAQCGPRVAALTWGGEDLASALGASDNKAEGQWTQPIRLARSLCLHAASACGATAIDTVYTDFRNPKGLERECIEAARDGFTGKLAIHPDQVPIINRCFTPTAEDIAFAKKIVSAFEASPGAGVLNIDGRMVDRPHLRKAESTLARAAAAK
ncbi:MAG: CoA ester lyase [Pseudomonadota bacterium]|nr:CoA ester lyase [Pseudomonadota bacterium]